MKPNYSVRLFIPIFFGLCILTIISILGFTFPAFYKKPTASIPPPAFINTSSDDYYIIPDGIKYQGNMVTQKKGLISLSTETGHNYYRIASDTDNTSFLYTEVQVDDYTMPDQQRLPLNISLVIDRSGSMRGEKLLNVKAAGKMVVDKLNENDFISIVVYESNVGVLQKSIAVKDKNALKEIINNIVDDGGTNLGGGMIAGYEQVKSTYKSGYVNRVLLLSDGLANEGITDFNILTSTSKKWLNDEGISISTFGVGNDYNENLMTSLAENGNGNYYYIKEATQIAAMVEKEINGLMSVVAQQAILKYELPLDIIITRVYGGNYEVENNILSIQLKDLFANEKKAVLIKFKIKNTATAHLIFSTQFSYIDATKSNQPMSIVNQNIIKPTSDLSLYLSNFSERVMQQCILYETNDMLEKTMQEVDARNFENAKISGSKNMGYYQLNAAKVSKSEEMQRQETSINLYDKRLDSIEYVTDYELKSIQKESKSENYLIRKKK